MFLPLCGSKLIYVISGYHVHRLNAERLTYLHGWFFVGLFHISVSTARDELDETLSSCTYC